MIAHLFVFVEVFELRVLDVQSTELINPLLVFPSDFLVGFLLFWNLI